MGAFITEKEPTIPLLQARSLFKLRLAPILLPVANLNWLALTLQRLTDLPMHPIPLIDQYLYWFLWCNCQIKGECCYWPEQIRQDKRLANQFRCNLPMGYDSQLHGDFQPELDLTSVNCGIDIAVGLFQSVVHEVIQYVIAVLLALNAWGCTSQFTWLGPALCAGRVWL